MYPTVPTIEPGGATVPWKVAARVASSGSIRTRRATPKSSTFTCPDEAIITLAGLMSRWTTPARCAAASAAAIWMA
ncbi:MAG TPA: hypothetical protein VL225_05460 [Vicinamibacterales bacterium]|nr:hypothetical protein [Vicinamibacterales bacterium]